MRLLELCGLQPTAVRLRPLAPAAAYSTQTEQLFHGMPISQSTRWRPDDPGPAARMINGTRQCLGASTHIAGLVSRDGAIILPQNGLSYWYFEKLGSPLRGSRLASVAPDGTLTKTFPLDAVIGGVVNKPANLVEPGRVRLADQPGDRIEIGELDNRVTPRLAAIKSGIESSGWPVHVTDGLRDPHQARISASRSRSCGASGQELVGLEMRQAL